MMSEKSWVHRLYFDAYFEHALTKMKSKTGLGSSYALFTALNDYFYDKGYMDEKGYHYHLERYSKPLIDEFEQRLEVQQQNVTLEIQKKQLEVEALNKKLTCGLNAWSEMKPKAQEYYLKLAEEHPDHPVSKQILRSAKELEKSSSGTIFPLKELEK